MLQSYMNFRVSDISDMWLLANWRIESGQLALLKDYYYQLYVLYMLGLTDAEHCERHDMKPDTNVNQGRAFSNKT
jgi:hypothetical protein